MKKALLPLFLLVCITVRAGEPLTYTGIDSVPGKSRDQLFSSARQWFSTTFTDSKAVLNVQDKETGELVGKGTFRYTAPRYAFIGYSGWIEYEVSIFVKDGRYKYVFTNFYHKVSSDCDLCLDAGLLTIDSKSPHSYNGINKTGSAKTFIHAKEEVQIRMNEILPTLKAAMIENAVDNDW